MIAPYGLPKFSNPSFAGVFVFGGPGETPGLPQLTNQKFNPAIFCNCFGILSGSRASECDLSGL